MSRLDPRDPLVLDTRDLVRRPGEMRRISSTAPAPEEMGNGVIGVPAGTGLDLDLRLESVLEGLLVSGSVRTQAEGQCVRCLEPVQVGLDVPVQELFAYPDTLTAEAEDVAPIEDDLVDLTPVLRDVVVLALPLLPVCRDDCPGLCPTCGARLAEDPQHGHDQVDPRWDALQKLSHDSSSRSDAGPGPRGES